VKMMKNNKKTIQILNLETLKILFRMMMKIN